MIHVYHFQGRWMPVTHARLLAICTCSSLSGHSWYMPFDCWKPSMLPFSKNVFWLSHKKLTVFHWRSELHISVILKYLVDRTFNENLRSTVRGCNAKRPKTATPNRVVCWSLLSHESESWTEARCMYVFFCFFRVRFLLTSELCCRSVWGCQWEDFLIIRLK